MFDGMIYNDDEPIVPPKDVSGEMPTGFQSGKSKTTIFSKTEAPLEASKFKMLMELTVTGTGSKQDRLGVDLVAVLDVSGSMWGDKIENMKTAMQFLISKLSPIDRLSVVAFAQESMRICPLHRITETSKLDIEKLINGLYAGGSTNITAGLQTGLKVLNDRSLTSERVSAIILMSDGEQTHGEDASHIPFGNTPIYTFRFGKDCDPKVLKDIADKSQGGTFSDVQNQDRLSIAFSHCLARLLTVVFDDLKLTFTQRKSTIHKVSAGNYRQIREDAVTVFFGDFYDKEIRKVIVDLLLPAVSSLTSSEDVQEVLQVDHMYRSDGILFDAERIIITVNRVETLLAQEREEVMVEENRLKTAQMMKQARLIADDNMRMIRKKPLISPGNQLQ